MERRAGHVGRIPLPKRLGHVVDGNAFEVERVFPAVKIKKTVRERAAVSHGRRGAVGWLIVDVQERRLALHGDTLAQLRHTRALTRAVQERVVRRLWELGLLTLRARALWRGGGRGARIVGAAEPVVVARNGRDGAAWPAGWRREGGHEAFGLLARERTKRLASVRDLLQTRSWTRQTLGR